MYPQSDNGDMPEDILSLNAVEHVARAANDSIQRISHEANADRR